MTRTVPEAGTEKKIGILSTWNECGDGRSKAADAEQHTLESGLGVGADLDVAAGVEPIELVDNLQSTRTQVRPN